jgi:hypothetical protein
VALCHFLEGKLISKNVIHHCQPPCELLLDGVRPLQPVICLARTGIGNLPSLSLECLDFWRGSPPVREKRRLGPLRSHEAGAKKRGALASAYALFYSLFCSLHPS